MLVRIEYDGDDVFVEEAKKIPQAIKITVWSTERKYADWIFVRDGNREWQIQSCFYDL